MRPRRLSLALLISVFILTNHVCTAPPAVNTNAITKPKLSDIPIESTTETSKESKDGTTTPNKGATAGIMPTPSETSKESKNDTTTPNAGGTGEITTTPSETSKESKNDTTAPNAVGPGEMPSVQGEGKMEGTEGGNETDHDNGNVEGTEGGEETDHDNGNVEGTEGGEKPGVMHKTEDKMDASSHFLAYFITACVLCIAGYVLFHNKQKIVAFIVEGRGGRTRRHAKGGDYQLLKPNVEVTAKNLDMSITTKNYVY